jgi:hypothetical protein
MGIAVSDLLGPNFTRLFHDTYVSSSQMINLRVRANTIMKRLPAATYVSHHTAVRLWGGVAPDSADIHLSMACREARCRRAGVAAHLGSPAAQTTICDGVPISTPVQAFLDLASVGVSLVDLVIAGIAWSRRMTSIRCSSWRPPMRIRVAMPNVLAVPPPSYALMSTRRWRRGYACSSFRWVARAAGQLHPAHRRRRVALAVRPLVPGVQVDHRVRGQHAFDSGEWIHDLERREWLDQDGWRMIIVVSEDIYVHPLRTLQRVKAALEDRGARVPKCFNQEWTRHFMVRA